VVNHVVNRGLVGIKTFANFFVLKAMLALTVLSNL
jgi:hypothetical protein